MFGRITALIFKWLIIALLAVSVTDTAYADEFDHLRETWVTRITGGAQLLPEDADVVAQRTKLTATAQKQWSALRKESDRQFLWPDLSDWTVSRTLTKNYSRLKEMALAYATQGSPLYRNQALGKDILEAFDWLSANKYNERSIAFDYYWDWEAGTPLRIIDIAALMYEEFGAARLEQTFKVIDHFCPDPTLSILNSPPKETGLGRLDKAMIVALRGILGKSPSKLAQARDAISQVFPYVTSGDGFYRDGSYIYRGYVAYVGGYGGSLIAQMANLLSLLGDSPWAITDPQMANIYHWIADTYQPYIYRGAALDAVRGRAVSRYFFNDHTAGRKIVTALAQIAQTAPTSQATWIKGLVKTWVSSDATFANYYDGLSVTDIRMLKALMTDASISAVAAPATTQVFAGMARALHQQPEFTFSISMFSPRVSAFDYRLEEGPGFWFTSAGMTMLYNADQTQYSINYWPTVDKARLPGTTTDGSIDAVAQMLKPYFNPQTWVGGATLEKRYASVGMEFSMAQSTGNDLHGKKSWFLFGDKIIALGTDIGSKDDRKIETIIENRKLNAAGDNAFTVSSLTQKNTPKIGVGSTELIPAVKWAHLAGSVPGSDIGYYFPVAADIAVLREHRSGAWQAINPREGRPDPVSNTYLSIAWEHGKQPVNASYAYVLLPNRTAEQTAHYAAAPSVIVLENSNKVQAAMDTDLHVVGANFWSDSKQLVKIKDRSYLSSTQKASVTIQEDANVLQIAIADPTQLNTGTIEIEIDRAAQAPLHLDEGIKVIQLRPSIRLEVNVNDAHGKSFEAKFQLKSKRKKQTN